MQCVDAMIVERRVVRFASEREAAVGDSVGDSPDGSTKIGVLRICTVPTAVLYTRISISPHTAPHYELAPVRTASEREMRRRQKTQ